VFNGQKSTCCCNGWSITLRDKITDVATLSWQPLFIWQNHILDKFTDQKCSYLQTKTLSDENKKRKSFSIYVLHVFLGKRPENNVSAEGVTQWTSYSKVCNFVSQRDRSTVATMRWFSPIKHSNRIRCIICSSSILWFAMWTQPKLFKLPESIYSLVCLCFHMNNIKLTQSTLSQKHKCVNGVTILSHLITMM